MLKSNHGKSQNLYNSANEYNENYSSTYKTFCPITQKECSYDCEWRRGLTECAVTIIARRMLEPGQ